MTPVGTLQPTVPTIPGRHPLVLPGRHVPSPGYGRNNRWGKILHSRLQGSISHKRLARRVSPGGGSGFTLGSFE